MQVRMLLGQELMCFVGWAKHDYVNGPFHTKVGNATLISLAGNAFSGFAAGPIFAAWLPMLGYDTEAQEEQGETIQVRESSSNSESESA